MKSFDLKTGTLFLCIWIIGIINVLDYYFATMYPLLSFIPTEAQGHHRLSSIPSISPQGAILEYPLSQRPVTSTKQSQRSGTAIAAYL